MAALSTERRQILAFDRVIKTRAWRSVLLVSPKADAEVNGLLNFCPRLRITALWDPGWTAPLAVPSEPLRRAAVLARLRVTEGANPRLRLLEGEPELLAAQLAREQVAGELAPFSGAVLANLDASRPFGPQLRCWAALLEPEGMLIGKQLDMRLRTELSAITPLWRPWPNGLWLLDVKHVLPKGSVEKSTPFSVSNEQLVNGAEPQIERDLNLTRTRPVWETLERNLGL